VHANIHLLPVLLQLRAACAAAAATAKTAAFISCKTKIVLLPTRSASASLLAAVGLLLLLPASP
jgi:hypothetical protein